MSGAASLAQRAHAGLLSMIAAGELKPGDILQEAPLGQRLDMSRTPVREALKRLESEGLAHPQGRFTRLRMIPTAEVEEIFFLRLALEPGCAHAAARQVAASPPARAEVTAMADRVTALHGDPAAEPTDTPWQIDVALHLLVARLAGNRATMRVVGDLHRRTSIFDHGLVPDRFAAACAQHLHILDAIAQGDAAEAEAAMRQHLSDACAAILARIVPCAPDARAEGTS